MEQTSEFKVGDPVYYEYTGADGKPRRIYGHVVGVFGRYVGMRANHPHPWPLRVEVVHHAVGEREEEAHVIV